MTKSPRKIVLRKETLRVLAAKDLSLAIGGGTEPGVFRQNADTGDNNCPGVVLLIK